MTARLWAAGPAVGHDLHVEPRDCPGLATGLRRAVTVCAVLWVSGFVLIWVTEYEVAPQKCGATVLGRLGVTKTQHSNRIESSFEHV